jgi:uncharacterized protein YgiB involved in biofilm formation
MNDVEFGKLVKAIQKLLPECSWGQDEDGQMVIYTNLIDCPNGEVLSMDSCAHAFEGVK